MSHAHMKAVTLKPLCIQHLRHIKAECIVSVLLHSNLKSEQLHHKMEINSLKMENMGSADSINDLENQLA